ncbi:putative amine oxidase [copper-containing] [Saccostrea cucullata]|uniref:putative amine oxidase [copper-containing] n=1 Tax=Saccostrea cuccullata TaxID=36930 RepID=UPI002ED372C1
MDEEYRDSARQWKTYSLVLLVFLVALVAGFAATIVYYEIIRKPYGATHCNRVTLTERPLEGDPGHSIFRDLTKNEWSALENYLYSNKAFNLKRRNIYAPNSSYLYFVELLLPNKTSALDFLDFIGRPQPPREARVVLFRGDKFPPVTEEYSVGPLHKIEYHRLLLSAPYLYRPVSTIETRAVRKLLRRVDVTLKYVLEESYEASFFDCDPQCLILDYYTPVTPAMSGRNVRLIWYWTHYQVKQFLLNPVDFFILFNLDGPDPNKYYIEKIWYSGQEYRSPEHVLEAYISGNSPKSSIPFPVDPHILLSVNPSTPTMGLRSPKVVEPDGHRYSVNQGRIQYMDWDFHIRMSTTSGPQLLDVKYRSVRILYELSLQEIAAFSSGHHPWLRHSSLLYSSLLLGRHARSLIPSVDCPIHATYISVTTSKESRPKSSILPNAFCVFEQDSGFPLRRSSSNNFFSGLSDISLTLRAILSVLGNEFIIDVLFRLNGVIETRVTVTGYPMGTFHAPQESRYGFRLRENFIAPIRQFSFHFKVDLDVHGTSNRFETIDIQTQDIYSGDEAGSDDKVIQQLKIKTDLKMTEQQGLIKDFFERYFIFHNDKIKTKYKDLTGYRIHMTGSAAGQLLSSGTGNEPSMSWSRYHIAVTKSKDTERCSSSIYSMWDSQKPVVNFQNYISDDEDIVDEDLVAWVTLRTYKVPSMESLPVFQTAGDLQSFFISPFNYYKEDPSITSRDALIVEPSSDSEEYLDKYNLTAYSIINNGITKSFKCSTEYKVKDKIVLLKTESLYGSSHDNGEK